MSWSPSYLALDTLSSVGQYYDITAITINFSLVNQTAFSAQGLIACSISTRAEIHETT